MSHIHTCILALYIFYIPKGRFFDLPPMYLSITETSCHYKRDWWIISWWNGVLCKFDNLIWRKNDYIFEEIWLMTYAYRQAKVAWLMTRDLWVFAESLVTCDLWLKSFALFPQKWLKSLNEVMMMMIRSGGSWRFSYRKVVTLILNKPSSAIEWEHSWVARID